MARATQWRNPSQTKKTDYQLHACDAFVLERRCIATHQAAQRMSAARQADAQARKRLGAGCDRVCLCVTVFV
jgi:hypothetical protein